MDLKLIVRGLWDRLGGWLLIGLGGLTLLLGWLGVSRTPLPSEQIPYVISGGLVGIALVGIGATLLISADLRDEWRKLDDIEAAIRGHAPGADAEGPATVRIESPTVGANGDSNGVREGKTGRPRRRAVVATTPSSDR